MKKIEFFKVEGDRINRIRKHCPKCGPAVFLAEHKNRFSCGKCGYAEFRGGVRPPKPPKTEDKTSEQPVQEQTETPKDERSVETSTTVPNKPTVEEPPMLKPQVGDNQEKPQTESAQDLTGKEQVEPEKKEGEPSEQPEQSEASPEEKPKKESIGEKNKE